MNYIRVAESFDPSLKSNRQAKENEIRAYKRLCKKQKKIKDKFDSLIGQIKKAQNSLKNDKRNATLDLIIELNLAFKRNLSSNFEAQHAFICPCLSTEKENNSLIKFFYHSNRNNLTKVQINSLLAEKIIRSVSKIENFNHIKDCYLNQICLNPYTQLRSSIECFLTEEMKEILYIIVLESKNSDLISLAASNAITILNNSGFSFTNKDLSTIKIPNADLSWGLFINTNFESSYLYGVNFSRANIYDSNFRNCNMVNVSFGKIWEPSSEIQKIKMIKFSPCGKFIAIAIESALFLYDAKTHQKIGELKGPKSKVRYALFSDNGNYLLAWTYNNERILWNTSTKSKIAKFSNSGKNYCFSPCSNYLCLDWKSISKKNIAKIYSIKTKKIINEIPYLYSEHDFLSFTPLSENLIIWNDMNLSIWNIFKNIKISQIGVERCSNIRISFDRKFIAARARHGIILYSVEKLEPLTSWKTDYYRPIFSPCGKYLSTYSNSHHKILNLSKGKEYAEMSFDWNIEFYPYKKYVLAKKDSEESPWLKTPLNDKANKKMFHKEKIENVCFTDNAKFFAISTREGFISIYQTENQNLLRKFQVCSEGCHRGIAWTDSILASICCSNSIKFWNIYDGSIVKVITTPEKYNRIKFSPSGKMMILGFCSSYADIWDIDNDQKIPILWADGINTFWLWSRFEDFVISVDAKQIKVGSQKISSYNDSKIDFVRLSFCGKYLLTYGDKKINIWYFEDLKKITKIKEICLDYYLASIEWLPDSKGIIGGSREGNIIIWDGDTGKMVKKIKAHPYDTFDDIAPIDISKTGHFISCNFLNSTIKLWNLDSFTKPYKQTSLEFKSF